MRRFEKKPLNLEQQFNKLKSKGLKISDKEECLSYLRNISYYRLKAYTYPFQDNSIDSEHNFITKNISFNNIIELYCFDGELRSIIFNAIEKIEVALRTRISSTYSNNLNDPFWFLNNRLYFKSNLYKELTQNEITKDKKNLGNLITEINRSNEDFIQYYKSKYNNPVFPPSWMTLEVVSMGTLSKLFSALDKNNISSKTICYDLGLYNVNILKNWIHALSSVRNICAHHSRVWNRRFTITLKLPNRTTNLFIDKKDFKNIRNNKLFAYLSIILYLLNTITPTSNFKTNIINLLKDKPLLVKLKDMGFPKNWESFPIWK